MLTHLYVYAQSPLAGYCAFTGATALLFDADMKGTSAASQALQFFLRFLLTAADFYSPLRAFVSYPRAARDTRPHILSSLPVAFHAINTDRSPPIYHPRSLPCWASSKPRQHRRRLLCPLRTFRYQRATPCSHLPSWSQYPSSRSSTARRSRHYTLSGSGWLSLPSSRNPSGGR